MVFEETTKNGVTFGFAPGLGEGAVHGFSTRLGGVSVGVYESLNLGASRGDDPGAVRENYRRFRAAVGAGAGGMVFSSQVHGDAVRLCTRADAGAGVERPGVGDADGLVTDVPGLALVVFSADCLPILLHDPVRQVIAAVHAGWRGTAAGIAERAVEKMRDVYGCGAEDLRAAIGPGISKCCFETDEDVPNAMTRALGAGALKYIEMHEGGKFHVDLKGLNRLRLERAGLSQAHIAVSPDCTACRTDKYWSHRVTGGERGSMAAIIQLTQPKKTQTR